MGRRRFVPTLQDRERADALRLERESRGLTQAEVAARIGVSTRSLRRMESGTGPISMTHWDRIQAVFAERLPAASSPPPPPVSGGDLDQVPAPHQFTDLTLQEFLLVTAFRTLSRERRALLVGELLASRWLVRRRDLRTAAAEDVPPLTFEEVLEDLESMHVREDARDTADGDVARKSSAS